MMTKTWINLIHRADDTEIGSAIVRLARQAVAAHQQEVVDQQRRSVGLTTANDAIDANVAPTRSNHFGGLSGMARLDDGLDRRVDR